MGLDMITIGKRIKERRKELHLTLADIKQMTGISTGNLSDIENGNRLPASPTLVQLADALQCSTDWILMHNIPNSENLLDSFSGDFEIMEMYKQLSKDEQEEIYMLLSLKVKRAKREKEQELKYTSFQQENDTKMA